MSAETTSVADTPAEPGRGLPALRSLSGLLRAVGAMTVIASVSIFLLQGWSGGNDVQRYLLLLAHTTLLAGTGLAAGQWLREAKGARLFLALALASVPANFAILGGFVYSQFGTPPPLGYPDVATWQVDSSLLALGVTAAAAALLAAITVLGFLALARRSARRLAVLFVAANAAILLPLRTPEAVAWLLLAMTAVTGWQTARLLRADLTLRTADGLLARLLLFLPAAVVLGRSLWLYAAGPFLWAAASLMGFVLLRAIAQHCASGSALRRVVEAASLVPALATGISLGSLVAHTLPGWPSLVLPVISLSTGALLVELSARAAGDGAGYRRTAAAIVAAGAFANLLLIGGVTAAAFCLVCGLLITVYGHTVQQQLVFLTGLGVLLAGLVYQIHYALVVFQLGSWGSLAALGVGAILLGSAVERHGTQLRARLAGWGQRFRAWEY